MGTEVRRFRSRSDLSALLQASFSYNRYKNRDSGKNEGPTICGQPFVSA
jgi:hypothetical protein